MPSALRCQLASTSTRRPPWSCGAPRRPYRPPSKSSSSSRRAPRQSSGLSARSKRTAIFNSTRAGATTRTTAATPRPSWTDRSSCGLTSRWRATLRGPRWPSASLSSRRTATGSIATARGRQCAWGACPLSSLRRSTTFTGACPCSSCPNGPRLRSRSCAHSQTSWRRALARTQCSSCPRGRQSSLSTNEPRQKNGRYRDRTYDRMVNSHALYLLS